MIISKIINAYAVHLKSAVQILDLVNNSLLMHLAKCFVAIKHDILKRILD